jgi:2-amino-4-hydroxy-6-hydroxymethyldihydropteridine diphosphokinase
MILIALGSNLPSSAGSPPETVTAALAALSSNGLVPVKVSRLYETEAWPDPSDPPFINAVAQLETRLPPPALLACLQAVEQFFGRKRGERNAPRTLDIDILDYDGRIEAGPPTLPHPRLESRAFVLVPLAEIAPDWRHPISHRSAAEGIAALPEHGQGIIALSSSAQMG